MHTHSKPYILLAGQTHEDEKFVEIKISKNLPMFAQFSLFAKMKERHFRANPYSRYIIQTLFSMAIDIAPRKTLFLFVKGPV